MSSRLPLLSGGFFDFEKPEDSIYTIEDIANGLCRQYRFGGHVLYPITVAQHSVILSKMVEPELALAALLHDGSEAFIGDIVRAAKGLLPDYRMLEESIMNDLFCRAGLDWGTLSGLIKDHDQDLGDFESQYCNNPDGPTPTHWASEETTEPFWTKEYAKTAFLMRWQHITRKPKRSILYRS